MNKDSIIFIGLDVHKSFIQIAVLQEHREANPQHLGCIKSNKSALIKLTKQLQSKYPKATLHFVYETGPCGYWTYRLMTSLGLVPTENSSGGKTRRGSLTKSGEQEC